MFLSTLILIYDNFKTTYRTVGESCRDLLIRIMNRVTDRGLLICLSYFLTYLDRNLYLHTGVHATRERQ